MPQAVAPAMAASAVVVPQAVAPAMAASAVVVAAAMLVRGMDLGGMVAVCVVPGCTSAERWTGLREMVAARVVLGMHLRQHSDKPLEVYLIDEDAAVYRDDVAVGAFELRAV